MVKTKQNEKQVKDYFIIKGKKWDFKEQLWLKANSFMVEPFEDFR